MVGIRGSYFYDSSVSTKNFREEALRKIRNGINPKKTKKKKRRSPACSYVEVTSKVFSPRNMPRTRTHLLVKGS